MHGAGWDGTLCFLGERIAWDEAAWGRGARRRHVAAPRLVASEGIEPPPQFGRRTVSVDIVVGVADALADVRACLEAIVRCTVPPYRLVLVDDGRGPATRAALRAVAEAQDATLLQNSETRGGARAANPGLAKTLARHVGLPRRTASASARWRTARPTGSGP